MLSCTPTVFCNIFIRKKLLHTVLNAVDKKLFDSWKIIMRTCILRKNEGKQVMLLIKLNEISHLRNVCVGPNLSNRHIKFFHNIISDDLAVSVKDLN